MHVLRSLIYLVIFFSPLLTLFLFFIHIIHIAIALNTLLSLRLFWQCAFYWTRSCIKLTNTVTKKKDCLFILFLFFFCFYVCYVENESKRSQKVSLTLMLRLNIKLYLGRCIESEITVIFSWSCPPMFTHNAPRHSSDFEIDECVEKIKL
jgi:hypothetical protein